MKWLLENWKLLFANALITISIGFYSGWVTKEAFTKAEKLDEVKALLKAQNDEQARAKRIGDNLEQLAASMREKAELTQQELRDEVKKPDYDCTITDRGLQLYNQAIAGYSATK